MSALEESVEFVVNAQPRCACVLILDTSGSMGGERIDALNQGLKTFRESLLSDEIASKRIEVAVVEFNSQVAVVHEFTTADEFHPPTLVARGNTDMAGGVNRALDLIQQRKRQYAVNGVPHFRPWAFLITDGEINNPESVAQRIRDEESRRAVAFFAVGVSGAREDSLRQLSVRPHKMLSGLKFSELFMWLSTSLTTVSKSVPGEMVPLSQPTGSWEVV